MRIWIKVCGLCAAESVSAAVQAGADALGFVLCESARQITPQRAAELIAPLPSHIARVAVFRIPTEDEIASVVKTPGFTHIQCDAVATPMVNRALAQHARRISILPVVRTVDGSFTTGQHPGHAKPEPDVPGNNFAWALAQRVLIEGQTSGHGQVADWSIAADFARLVPAVLAGGLTVENVQQAISAVRPSGVDVSSGVERQRGIKDPDLIRAFCLAVRNAERHHTFPPQRQSQSNPASVANHLRELSKHIQDERIRSRTRTNMPTNSNVQALRDPFTSASHSDTAFGTNAAELAKLLSGEYPDARGRYGPFGGRFVPETLMGNITRLEEVTKAAFADQAFWHEFDGEAKDWIGRPTPVMFARKLSELWGIKLYFKREDLAHTGAHKINNALGQALLAKRLGVKRIIAETGAGQHGVATAAACARIGFPCSVYMGAHDIERQAPNVQRMKRLGATVIPVTSGDATLRAAIDEALRAWVADPEGTHYLLGSAVGPHPFPLIVRTFQSVIGREARAQMLDKTGKLPDAVFACVGGGSNAIGIFHGFLGDPSVQIFGIEAGGRGEATGDHSATMTYGTPGVLHGCYSYLLQDPAGQVANSHSVSAGLDYPGVGPEHAFLRTIGRVKYTTARDDAALAALADCCRYEGILPALEPSHALAAIKEWAKANPGKSVLVGFCGRGDKDMPILQAAAPID